LWRSFKIYPNNIKCFLKVWSSRYGRGIFDLNFILVFSTWYLNIIAHSMDLLVWHIFKSYLQWLVLCSNFMFIFYWAKKNVIFRAKFSTWHYHMSCECFASLICSCCLLLTKICLFGPQLTPCQCVWIFRSKGIIGHQIYKLCS
jgi:hypothetical protein